MGINNYLSFKKIIKAKAHFTGDFLEEFSQPYFINLDISTLDSIASQIPKDDPDVDFVIFYDDKNTPLTKLPDEKLMENAYITEERKIISPSGLNIGSVKIGFNNKQLKENIQTSVLIIFISTISSIIILVIGLRLLTNKIIINPINQMKITAEKIASGDLTSQIKIEGEDELASLSRSINSVASNLKNMLEGVRSVSNSILYASQNMVTYSENIYQGSNTQHTMVESTAKGIEEIDVSISKVASGAETLTIASGDVSSSILEITTSVENVAESATSLSVASSDSASSVEELTTSIKEISDSLEQLSATSEETASSLTQIIAAVKEVESNSIESARLAEQVTNEAADKGIKSVESALKAILEIKDTVNSLAGSIKMLGERSNEIGQIVNIISDITDQTKLLALNAAILAAQASEEGKGFSVVAEEIKVLANKTQQSTEEITKLISTVQSETLNSVKLAEQGIGTVENGVNMVKNVSSALNSILDISKASTEKAKSIQRSTKEQTDAIKGISDAIRKINDQIEHISRAIKEQSKGSKLIMEVTDKVKEQSYIVKTATTEQTLAIKQISKNVVSITDQTGEIAKATAMQREKSKDIVMAVENIKITATEFVKLSDNINSEIKALEKEARQLLSEISKFKLN